MDTCVLTPSREELFVVIYFANIHRLAGRFSISDTYDANCLSVYFHNNCFAHPT